MFYAALGGHIEIVKLCKEYGGTDYDMSMYCAAKNGHIEIVKLCKEYGGTNYNAAMEIEDSYIEVYGAENGDDKIVKLCREWLGFEGIHNELYQYHHKRSFSKKIGDELIPIAWHPDRWQDWCLTEDEKKRCHEAYNGILSTYMRRY